MPMPPISPVLSHRLVGSMLGLAVGDAQGAPHEGGLLERWLWRCMGRTRTGHMRYTDDTQMCRDLTEALLHHHGFIADAVAHRFAHSYRWSRGYGPGAAQVLKRIRRGQPWQQARLQVFPNGSWGNGGAMRAPVAAWWTAADGAAATAALARAQAAITHAHALALDGAALIAVAVHMALRADLAMWNPVHWLVQVAQHANLQATDAWHARLTQSMAWLQAPKSTAPCAQEVAQQLGNGIAAVDSCVTALYIAARFATHDFDAMLRFVQQMGGDVDTIAAMAGSVYGALRGIDALPAHAIAQLEDAPALRQLAEQLESRHPTQAQSTFSARQSM